MELCSAIGKDSELDPKLQLLLNEYVDIFEEPKTLPPHREHDHKILLRPGTTPINVRPYRYPTLQKDVIEKVIQEMLQAWVIRASQILILLPLCLSRRRMDPRGCVDHRSLNKHTILDRVSIPVIEELLDELHGAEYFSKIDMRSGY